MIMNVIQKFVQLFFKRFEKIENNIIYVENTEQLGSVAGPVIQPNGRLIFEDDLRSGGLLCFTTQ